MKYKLCDWEENGYNDSDFRGIYFDTDDGKLHNVLLGSTRFAGGGYTFGEDYSLPTPEIVELARLALAEFLAHQATVSEKSAIETPEIVHVRRGTEFRLLEPHSVYRKNVGGGFAKDKNGKRVKKTFPVGHVFKCRSDEVGFFGTVYTNGYNKPNRFNVTVATSFSDETGTWFIAVPLEKLRQNCEPTAPEKITEWADKKSRELGFGALGCRAWLSNNWAANVQSEVDNAVTQN